MALEQIKMTPNSYTYLAAGTLPRSRFPMGPRCKVWNWLQVTWKCYYYFWVYFVKEKHWRRRLFYIMARSSNVVVYALYQFSSFVVFIFSSATQYIYGLTSLPTYNNAISFLYRIFSSSLYHLLRITSYTLKTQLIFSMCLRSKGIFRRLETYGFV